MRRAIYPHPFYLSRKLDIDEQQQTAADQRSVRFDSFNGKTVLAITGNYYAAYPANQFSGEQPTGSRNLPQCGDAGFESGSTALSEQQESSGYVLEISHHILGRVMSVSMERPENLVVFLPQNAALKLFAAKDETAQQAALLEGQTLLNAAPITIWLNGQGPQLASNPAPANPSPEAATSSSQRSRS